MNRFFVVWSLIIFSFTTQAQVLWLEDFEGEANGATSGTASGTVGGTWSANVPGGTFARGSGGRNSFKIDNTGSEGVWTTAPINISSAGYAIIDITFGAAGIGFSGGDYVRAYYIIDGGSETYFAGATGSFLSSVTHGSAIVSGSSLQIVVRGNDGSFLGAIDFEDVTVTAAPVLYSRKPGTWTDVTGGLGGTGMWSTSRGGLGCGCVPLNDIVAIIQNGHTVTIPTSQTAVGTSATPNLAPGAIDIESGGILQFNFSGVTMGIQEGLLRVRGGGIINSSSGAITGETISFNGDVPAGTFQIDAGGTATIENLTITTDNTHFLSGGGILNIQDDIRINADDSYITNDLTTLSVTDRIHFMNGVTDATFENNQTINGTNSTSTIYFEDSDCTFQNDGTVSIGSIFVATNGDDDNTVDNNSTLTFTNTTTSIDGTSADLFIENSGTINQPGNFANLVNNDDFANQNGGTWNWSLNSNTIPANFAGAMNCTTSGNTFVYNGSAAQNIGAPAGGYYNLTLRGSGVKTAGALVDVNGALNIETFVTLAGGTNNFDVEGLLTMTSGNITGSGQADINNTVNMTGSSTWNTTGVVNVTGSVTEANTSSWNGNGVATIGGSITLSNSSTWGSTTTVNVTGDVTMSTSARWIGTGTANITGNLSMSGSTTWTGNGAVNAGTGFVMTGGTFSGNGAINSNGPITISGTGQLNGAGNINIAGAWSMADANSFLEGTRLVTFDGSSQSITNSAGTETFHSLTVNMGAAANTLTLSNDITVGGTGAGVLTLTRGRMLLSGRNLTMTNAATGGITGASANSYIQSETNATPYARIIWNMGATNGAYTFPFGFSGTYIPYTFTKTVGAAANGTVSAATYGTVANNTPFPSGVSHLNNAGGTNQSTLVVDRWWIVNSTNYSTLTASQSLSFLASEGSSATTPRTARRWGSYFPSWETATATSNTNPFPVPSGTIYPANVWTVTANSAALPVELVNFSAMLRGTEVHLNWKTASEKNNDCFTIERAQDIEHFQEVKRVKGHGTSSESHSYSAIDESPMQGRTYYRLKQTDFDGTVAYSHLEVIDYSGPEFAVIHAYPNPGDGKTLTLEILGLNSVKSIMVEMISAKGAVVWKQLLEVKTPGSIKEDIVFASPLAPGLYIVRAGPTLALTRKIVIK